jgi:CHAD domain-containing protein
MAHAVSFPSRALSEHRGLAFWMKRTLEELANLRSEQTAGTVHDLRVSLRRCRSVAAVMEEIDPHPDWEEMRKAARKLFRALGELRDAHVMTDWLNQLQPETDSLKAKMLEALAAAEKTAQEKALRQAQRFAVKEWKMLSRTLSTRLRRVPLDGDAAHCLALERLEEARELHRRAMRTESAKPWHALRMGVKRFRYTAESFLPTAHEEWNESLKRLQDVLGNIHDLDLLAAMVKKVRAQQDSEQHNDWDTRIQNERHKNQETYRQLALGTASIWTAWLGGFPRQDWPQYANARIRATRSALDPKPARSRAVARLAMRMWSRLSVAKLGEVFSNSKERRVLDAVARLVGIDHPAEKGSREKSARSFLLRSPVPPRWTFAEWERVAWAVRFQRGAEPTQENKRFSRLTAEQQAKIVLLAGILRLAITAQKCGLTAGRSLDSELLPQGLLLTVGGAEDSPKNAARFAEAKRLLERSLGKTILIRLEPETDESANRKPSAEPIALISIVR